MQPLASSDLQRIADQVGARVPQVAETVRLLEAGCTVPFISRFRKDATGGLSEERIRRIRVLIQEARALGERKAVILKSLEVRGKLTDDLRAAILAAASDQQLEDLCAPYKSRRKGRSADARARDLEPVLEALWSGQPQFQALAEQLLQDGKFASMDQLWNALDQLVGERVIEHQGARSALRKAVWETGYLEAQRAAGSSETVARPFREYFQYRELLKNVAPHRVLVLNRGERRQALEIRITADLPSLTTVAWQALGLPENHPYAERLRASIHAALERVLLPHLGREIRRELTRRAEEHALEVFAANLRCLLMQPPLIGQPVLAIDPGYRTGCKLVVLDPAGNPLDYQIVYPHEPKKEWEPSKEVLVDLVRKHGIRVAAVGNGTASRETEVWLGEIIRDHLPEIRYVVVHEAGAKEYATGAAGREEFPNRDADFRGAVSLGRRLLDPLAELVKVDPEHLGIGLYQHDVNRNSLRERLTEVLESCVNAVGADLNRASVWMLRYISGLNPALARRIVEWRQKNGAFRSREQLKEIEGITEHIYTQAAGFLRVIPADNPLDSTWVHPESYPIAERLLERAGTSAAELRNGRASAKLRAFARQADLDQVAADLGIGHFAIRDMLDALIRPDRDPRDKLPQPVFKKGFLNLEDLQPGMALQGTVLNVVDFGAFVDVGVNVSGLVHVSRLSRRFIRDPHRAVAVGQTVRVWVVEVDRERQRLSLTMVPPEEAGAPRTSSRVRFRPRAAISGTRTPVQAEPEPQTSAAAVVAEGSPRPAEASRPERIGPALAARGPGPETPPSGRPRPEQQGMRRRALASSQALPRGSKPRKEPKPAVNLSEEALEGRAPLRSFSELKALWEKLHATPEQGG
jgi:uncharacterized protein